jgi:hypothetical protein
MGLCLGNAVWRTRAAGLNPLLLSFKSDFTAMISWPYWSAGALDDLPLSITNGDMNPTTQGVVSGLVEWELMRVFGRWGLI